MKQLYVLIVMLSFFFAACTNQYKIPKDIIPKDKMEKVLWDMIMADRYSTLILSRDSTKNVQEETFKAYAQVFSINKISREEFVKSFKFYLQRPDISSVMLDSLATKANRRRDDVYKSGIPR